jgi:hypothetical protein
MGLRLQITGSRLYERLLDERHDLMEYQTLCDTSMITIMMTTNTNTTLYVHLLLPFLNRDCRFSCMPTRTWCPLLVGKSGLVVV